jgi:hypothetical protein
LVAKGNQSGFYDYLKGVLGSDFEIIWRSGEQGKIRSEDIISMASIPLLFLAKNGLLPDYIKPINKISIYSQKGKCVDFFNEIMEHPNLSSVDKGRYNLTSEVVKSALEMTTKNNQNIFQELVKTVQHLSSQIEKLEKTTNGLCEKINTMDTFSKKQAEN